MRCESAPVAKSEHFVQLGNEIAKTVALQSPASVEALLALSDGAGKTINDRVAEVIGVIRENMKMGGLKTNPACAPAVPRSYDLLDDIFKNGALPKADVRFEDRVLENFEDVADASGMKAGRN